MRAFGVLFALLLSAVPALSLETLVPEVPQTDTALQRYDALIRSVLKDAYRPDVAVRMLVIPSFTPEFALGLKETNGAYRIFRIEPQVHLWNYALVDMMKNRQMSVDRNANATADAVRKLESAMPANPQDVGIKACEIGIDAGLGRRIADVWAKMLSRTKAPLPDPPGQFILDMDGTAFHFSMPAGDAELTGKTRNADPQTAPGMLAGIAITMSRMCLRNDRASEQLDMQVDALAQRLQ